MPLDINIIIETIKKALPRARISFEDKGPDPEISQITRYIVKISFRGTSMEIRTGPNVVFYLNGCPVRALRYLPLLPRDSVINFIKECIINYEKMLLDRELPEVKAYARKYLGQEERVVVKHNFATYIYYSRYFLVITPISIFLVGKKE